MNNDKETYYKTCESCGRPMAYCKGQCCGKPRGCQCQEYGPKVCGAIRPGEPSCPHRAVIPTLTVESVSNLKDLADCLVHVSDINTTFYIDDKHRIVITWAGPVNIPGYDMEGNPNNYRDQIVTDTEAQAAVIYDRSGKGYMFGLAEDLDVQDEINNKLDEMAEDGTLQEIITSYIQANVTWTFNTVADMKVATNLIDGSYARTLGYYEAGDGGGASYLITDTTDATKWQETLNSNLYATLLFNDTLNMKQIGCHADGVTDNYSLLQSAMNLLDKGTIYFPAGVYAFASPVELYSGKCISLKGDGTASTKFIDTCTTPNHIFFSSSLVNNGVTHEFIHGISYKDFEVIANEYTKVGFKVDKVAWLQIINVIVRNVHKTGTLGSSDMSCSILFAGQLCYCNNFSSPQHTEGMSYEYPYAAMWINNSTSTPSIRPTNNEFVSCKWENTKANLFMSYGDNNVFENCAIEQRADYDINISSECRWNTFIGIGSEESVQSLRDNGYFSTFIGCYFARDVLLNSRRSQFIGCSIAIQGDLTITNGSIGTISNCEIFKDPQEGKGNLVGAPNGSTWDFSHVYNYQTSKYEYWIAGRVGATIDQTTLKFTNPYQRNCIFHLTGGADNLTSMTIRYNEVGSAYSSTNFTQDILLTPGGTITFNLTSGGSIANVSGWIQELQ